MTTDTTDTMPKILDCRELSDNMSSGLKKTIDELDKTLKLAVIMVGDNQSSAIYVKAKEKMCNRIGIDFEHIHYNSNVRQDSIINEIKRLNKDNSVTGILVQLPLPEQYDTRKILDMIRPDKDVDGLSSSNLIKLMLGKEEIIPCTPKGILQLLTINGISLEGKNVTIVGFSDIVGKPLLSLCIHRGATLTLCTNKTLNLKRHTSHADIIMSATGVPKLITRDMVKDGAVVIDIGITRVDDKVVGDVDFDNVKDRCSYITPVPGGVGKLTIIALIQNLLLLHYIQDENKNVKRQKMMQNNKHTKKTIKVKTHDRFFEPID